MPLLASVYQPKNILLKKSHLSTILPTLLGTSDLQNYRRKKLSLKDGAIIETDWLVRGSPNLLVLLPGLEGHSKRIYTSRAAQAAFTSAWDVLLVNYRGYNQSYNPVPKTYHGGAIDDLHEVLSQTIVSYPGYQSISLGGFSLGGNIVLNYLGNARLEKSNKIRSGICFSVPCDFSSSSPLLASGPNHWIYGRRFVASLKKRVREEDDNFNGLYDLERFKNIKTLKDFDDVFTSRVNGFGNAAAYYKQVSSLQFLDQISVPTLLVNAENDPLLSEECYPKELAKKSSIFHLETPAYGGHVGFANDLSFEDFYYTERLVSWLADVFG